MSGDLLGIRGPKSPDQINKFSLPPRRPNCMYFLKVDIRAAKFHAECSKREVPISHMESARDKHVQKDAPPNLEKGAESERSPSLISSPFVTKRFPIYFPETSFRRPKPVAVDGGRWQGAEPLRIITTVRWMFIRVA